MSPMHGYGAIWGLAKERGADTQRFGIACERFVLGTIMIRMGNCFGEHSD